MNIYCAKCGAFFKNWKLDIIECCGKEMNILKDPVQGGVIPTKNVHLIIPDIQPYQAVAIDAKTGTAPMITSRKEHREFLKRNDYVVAETDSRKSKKDHGDYNVREHLAQATHDVLRKYR